VEFGLLDARGRLISNPVHYRDGRTDGMLERATQRVPPDEIYAATGIQFMSINALYQLVSMVESNDPDLQRAPWMLMIPDLFHHFLSGSDVSEYTNDPLAEECHGPRAGPGGAACVITERDDAVL